MQLWPYKLASENVIEMENLSLIPEQYGIYELFLIKPISDMEYPSKRQRIKLDRKIRAIWREWSIDLHG